MEDRLNGVPGNTWIPTIKPSSHSANEAFLVCDNHRRGDQTPYAFHTADAGATWTRLANNGVVRGYALSIEQDTVNPDLLFLGTEWGLYFSMDRGANWQQWTSGFPHGASTMALKVHHAKATS